ncbi:MAG: TIGR01212 family radical SAM protein [Epulopiscium sp. Nele67-Bin004]|nr:MAG: TIGR01212 family radical SAM protein [Epulopiscium sp. Nele67-Bin004]
MQRYYTLNQFLRDRHGEKVMKLSIDGGFDCPNRDGTVGVGGCIFCSSRGSGDFSGNRTHSIHQQIQSQIDMLSAKWGHITKYIAYFQSYSNTYAPLSELIDKFETALQYKGIIGIAIGTRADCLTPEIINYLGELATRTHVWVELGLQTIHTDSISFINRCHDTHCFSNAVSDLHAVNVETVAHIILGLPNETREHMLETAKYVASLPLQGVKIHMLHVLDNAPLGQIYIRNPFPLLTQTEYISIVGNILEILPSNFVIHRITGDGDKQHLIAPVWTLNKRNVLNSFSKYFEEYNIIQGNKNKY